MYRKREERRESQRNDEKKKEKEKDGRVMEKSDGEEAEEESG